MGCSICRPAAKLHFEDVDIVNSGSAATPVDSAVYELLEDFPNCFLTRTSFALIRVEINNPQSIQATAYARIGRYAKKIFVSDDMSKFKPYCGRDKTIFIQRAEATFNSMLYLAIVGAVSSNHAYLAVSKQILLSWAMALPAPGSLLADSSHPASRLTATGLTLGRFVDRIVETYRILAASMAKSEMFFVQRWLTTLGATIKLSHEFWLETYKMEGPQNHLSWQIFGMTAIGIFTHDEALLRYALAQPQQVCQDADDEATHSEASSPWNFRAILSAAIYKSNQKKNKFRAGCNALGKDYCFDGRAEAGEIWDRYRTLDVNKPNSGLVYCLFNLRAMTFTAHIVDSNNVLASLSYFQSEDEAEEKEVCVPLEHQKSMSFMTYGEGAILQALHFYGNYFIQYPVGTPSHITYPPYQGQQLPYEDLAEFLIGWHHFPEDAVLQQVIDVNIITPRNVLEIEPEEEQTTSQTQSKKLQKENDKKQEPATEKAYQMLQLEEETPSTLQPRIEHRFSRPDHPLHTPICYLSLVLCPIEE